MSGELDRGLVLLAVFVAGMSLLWAWGKFWDWYSSEVSRRRGEAPREENRPE